MCPVFRTPSLSPDSSSLVVNLSVALRREVRSRGEERKEGGRLKRMEVRGDERSETDLVTWNVKKLRVRETNRKRLRRLGTRVTRERWEMVLLTELKAEDGMVGRILKRGWCSSMGGKREWC